MKLDEYSQKVSAEIMAGEGPDVLLFLSYMPFSLRKIMDMGALADLNEFIEKDPEFKMDDYNKAVMDCGLYQGKRYLIPLYYSVKAFITTDELLSRNDFRIDLEHWTLGDLAEQIARLNNRSEDGKKVYFNHYPIFIDDCFSGSENKFIDYENKKVYFNTPEFIKFLNDYKTIYNAKLPDDFFTMYNKNIYNIMKDNQLLVYFSKDLLFPGWLWGRANNIDEYLDSEARLYPFPTANGGGKYAAEGEYLLAMNQQCQNKQLAYSFIKTFLSEDIQSSEIISQAPVNQAAYEKHLEKYSGDQGIDTIPLSPLLIEDLRHINSNITISEIQDYNVMNMIQKEIGRFLEGSSTAEQAAKEINSKVMLYLNE